MDDQNLKAKLTGVLICFILTVIFTPQNSFSFTLVKEGKIDRSAFKQLKKIIEGRHGEEYAELFMKAINQTREPGHELFRVMPHCFVNQRLMHFSGLPLSITFRPKEVNTCKFCHQPAIDETVNDAFRQKDWPKTTHNINPWINVFDPVWLDTMVPPSSIPTKISDYVRVNNLEEALVRSKLDLENPEADFQTVREGRGEGLLKYFPDLDPSTVDPRTGWANNGWRAYKWKPLPFTYPTALGGWKQIYIRMPKKFRLDLDGKIDRAVYEKNLFLLEMAMKGEVIQSSFVGIASNEKVQKYRYPKGTEFILAIHYLDPILGKAIRVQDYRYMVKSVPDHEIAVSSDEDLSLGHPTSLPNPPNEYETTLEHLSGGEDNPYGVIYGNAGWDLITYLEKDTESGRLRPSIREENQFCIGCHGRSIGVMRDGIWSFQRKLPENDGWRVQDFKLIKDYINPNTQKGDFFEWNTEANLSSLALIPYVDNDHPDLVGGLPLGSYDHALLMFRKYYQIVKTQTHLLGRFPSASTVPPVVFEKIVNNPNSPVRGAQNSYVVTQRKTDLDFSNWQTATRARQMAKDEIEEILQRMKEGVIQGTYTAYRRQELIERLEEARRGLRPSLQSLGKSHLTP